MGYFTTLETLIDSITQPDSATEEKLARTTLTFVAYRDKNIVEPRQEDDSFFMNHHVKEYRPQGQADLVNRLVYSGDLEHRLAYANYHWTHTIGVMQSYTVVGSKLIINPSSSWNESNTYFWSNIVEKDIHVNYRPYTIDEINEILDAFIAYPGKRKCMIQLDQPLAINIAFIDKLECLSHKKNVVIKLSPLNLSIMAEVKRLSTALQRAQSSEAIVSLRHEKELEQKKYEGTIDQLKHSIELKEKAKLELAQLLDKKEQDSFNFLHQLAEMAKKNEVLRNEIDALRSEKYFRELVPEILKDIETRRVSSALQREYARNLSFVYQNNIENYLTHIDDAPAGFKETFEQIFADLAMGIEYADSSFFTKDPESALALFQEDGLLITDENNHQKEFEIIKQECNTESVREIYLTQGMKNEAILMILRDRKARERTGLDSRLKNMVHERGTSNHGFFPKKPPEKNGMQEYIKETVGFTAS